jgi:hypothetical protein
VENFFLLFAGFQGRRVCRSDLYVLVQDLKNLIADLYSLWKNSRFQKKNRSNRSPDEGDIADLKISRVGDNFSGQRICGADLDVLVQDLQDLIADLESLWKNTQFQKKNQANRSPDEGDIADLKSALFAEILGDGGRVAAQIWNSSAWIRISITWADAEWLFHF